VPDGVLIKLDPNIFIEHTRDCIDPADNGRLKTSGHRQLTQYLNDKRNLVLPVVDPSKLNHLLLRYVMEKYVKTEDSLLYRYTDGLREAPKSY